MTMPKWIAGTIATFWVLFFGIDYLWHHTYYLQALESFPYIGAIVFLLLMIAGVALLHHVKKGTWMPFASKGWNGLAIWGVLLLTEIVLFAAYAAHSQALNSEWTTQLPTIVLSIVTAHAFLGLIVLIAIGLGGYATRLLGLQYDDKVQTWIQIAAGFGLMALLLMGVSAIGLLQGWTPWLLLLIAILPQVKFLGATLHRSMWKQPPIFTVHPLVLLPFVALLVLVGGNLLGINRPVPIGFDAVNFYMNIPHLLAQDGSLVVGGQPYNWSLIMSLGFTGWESTRFALLLSVLPGILSIGVIYRLARLYLPVGFSLLSATVFYALPMVTWQSTQEAKVDLALTFILLVVLLAFLAPLTKDGKRSGKPILIGFLLGIAVGIKFTALFAILGIGVAWLYQQQGWRTALGGGLMAVGSLFVLGLYRFAPITLNLGGSLAIGGVLVLAGLAIWLYHKSNLPTVSVWRSLAVLAGVILLTFSPWLGKNALETKSLGFKELITGKPLYPELPALQQLSPDDPQSQRLYWLGQPLWAQQGTLDLSRVSQEELRQRQQLEAGVYEEVARYMGYESTLPKYLTLPYDMTMRANVSNYVVDSGMWLWLLLPLLLLGSLRKGWAVYVATGLLLLFGALSVYGGWAAFGLQDWADAAGVLSQGKDEVVLHGLFTPLNQVLFYIGNLLFGAMSQIEPTVVALLFFLLGIVLAMLLGYQQRQWATGPIKVLLVFALLYLVAWWLLGSGIPWYGQLGFAIAPIILLYWLRTQLSTLPYLYYLGIGVVSVSLLLSVLQRWTSPDPLNPANQQFLVPLFAQYTAGEKTAEEVYFATSGKYSPVLETINAEPNGKVLRFGTFINYYIRNNTERVYLDNQLNNFKYLYDYVEGDTDKLFDLLETLDIRYIVMSLNVGDDTEEQLLGQKATLMMDFIKELFYRDEPLIRLIHTDQDPQAQQQGSYAAYELLYY